MCTTLSDDFTMPMRCCFAREHAPFFEFDIFLKKVPKKAKNPILPYTVLLECGEWQPEQMDKLKAVAVLCWHGAKKDFSFHDPSYLGKKIERAVCVLGKMA
jgi:hypothetical protein